MQGSEPDNSQLSESRLFCALQHKGCDIYYYEYHLY